MGAVSVRPRTRVRVALPATEASRIRAVVPAHAAYWRDLQLPGYRTGALVGTAARIAAGRSPYLVAVYLGDGVPLVVPAQARSGRSVRNHAMLRSTSATLCLGRQRRLNNTRLRNASKTSVHRSEPPMPWTTKGRCHLLSISNSRPEAVFRSRSRVTASSSS